MNRVAMTPAEWDAWFDSQPVVVLCDPMVAFVREMVEAGQEIKTIQWRWVKEHGEDVGGWFEGPACGGMAGPRSVSVTAGRR